MSTSKSDDGELAGIESTYRIIGTVTRETEEEGVGENLIFLMFDQQKEERVFISSDSIPAKVQAQLWPGYVLQAQIDEGDQQGLYEVQKCRLLEETTLSLDTIVEEELPDTVKRLSKQLSGSDGPVTELMEHPATGDPLYEIHITTPPEDVEAADLWGEMISGYFSFEKWFDDSVYFDEPAKHLSVVWPETEYFVFFSVPPSTDDKVATDLRKGVGEVTFP